MYNTIQFCLTGHQPGKSKVVDVKSIVTLTENPPKNSQSHNQQPPQTIGEGIMIQVTQYGGHTTRCKSLNCQ